MEMDSTREINSVLRSDTFNQITMAWILIRHKFFDDKMMTLSSKWIWVPEEPPLHGNVHVAFVIILPSLVFALRNIQINGPLKERLPK